MSHFGILTSFDHNTGTWQVYKNRLSQWFIANDITKDSDTTGAKRRAILLSALGEATYKLAADLALPKLLHDLPYEDIHKILDAHFSPKRCVFGERFKFYSAVQKEGESYTEWAARLRGLTEHCSFSNLEEALRDRFIMGMLSGKEREKLFALEPGKVTLAKAVELAESVRNARAGAAPAQASSSPDQLFKIATKPSVSANAKVKCAVCGFKNHTTEQCRFANYTCRKCNKKGHLNRMCKKINYVENESVGENGDDGELLNIRTVNGEPMTEIIDVNGVRMKFQYDCGSAVTAISEQVYLQYFEHVPLSQPNKRLHTYIGGNICCVGIAPLVFSFWGKPHTFDVHVIRNGGPPILGRDFMAHYGLGITTPVHFCESSNNFLDILQKQYPAVFSDELGTFNKYKIKLFLKSDSKPIFFKARPMAFALRQKVENELERLVRVGILKPVEYSEYASPVVPVLKRDGSLRLCADYSVSINKQLLVEQYPLPTAQELFTKLHGGQQFSKLDLSQAYAQCVLDDESQKLTCINTHKGLFLYTRLVYGLASAPAIFQRVMECVLAGMDGVLCMLDDVLVTGANREEHLTRLRAVLQRLQDAGLTLQKAKCDFFKDELEYLGYTINKHGLKKSPKKVDAIVNAPTPTNVASLQSFLGLVNYYRNFVPSASSLLSPLYQLLQKGSKWVWNTEHNDAFMAIKKHLSSDQLLAHYNPNATIILTTDASPYGLGAILSLIDDDGVERPVSYASRTLNAAEKRYSQLQKEATSIIFGVRRFHQYLYGRTIPFVLRTDHKPLISIFGPYKGIPEVSANRLQRYAMFLCAYNYTIEYIRSADNSADYLSRATLPGDSCTGSQSGHETSAGAEFIDDRASYINFVVDDTLPITFNTLREECIRDLTLRQVIKYVQDGWPRKISDSDIRPYFLCRNQLSVENGCLMRGHKIVIPSRLQTKILAELHKSHLGIVKCKAEARSRLWFPGIDKAIESTIGSCLVCSQLRPTPPRAPLAVWPYPQQVFYRIHTDILGPVNNKSYLVVVDAYSKWVEVYLLNNTTSNAIIAKLYDFMSRFGLMHTLVSDNGTCFSSNEFAHFCAVNGISHITSPAYNPASNGQAESFVKVVKKGIRACLLSSSAKEVDQNLLKYLFDYRNSVHTTTGVSPAQLVFGRKLRSRLDLIIPNVPAAAPPSPDTLADVVNYKQCLQTKAYGGTNKQCFKPGDKVMFKKYLSNSKFTWNRGVVIKRLGKTVYIVQDSVTALQLKKHKNQLVAFTGTVTNNKQSGTIDRDTTTIESTSGDDIDLSLSELCREEPEMTRPETAEPPQSPTVEGSGTTPTSTATTPPDLQTGEAAPPTASADDGDHDEFFEAREQSHGTEGAQDAEAQLEAVSPSRTAGQMSLRPVPRVDYKPFFCIM
ncbi:uncharacterized protein K02A2.6-like [Cydia amplana]|uniref:uncharacterized protein K02A2.6-like n=1 Tax=Cydia amplana TaxID=1869771 RepID=UPI002FE5FCF4